MSSGGQNLIGIQDGNGPEDSTAWIAAPSVAKVIPGFKVNAATVAEATGLKIFPADAATGPVNTRLPVSAMGPHTKAMAYRLRDLARSRALAEINVTDRCLSLWLVAGGLDLPA